MELLISRGRDLERERDGREEREEDRKGEGGWGLEERKGFWRRLDGGRAIGEGGREGMKKAELGLWDTKRERERELGSFKFIGREGEVDGGGGGFELSVNGRS